MLDRMENPSRALVMVTKRVLVRPFHQVTAKERLTKLAIKNEMNPKGARTSERHLGERFVTTKLISSTIRTTS